MLSRSCIPRLAPGSLLDSLLEYHLSRNWYLLSSLLLAPWCEQRVQLRNVLRRHRLSSYCIPLSRLDLVHLARLWSLQNVARRLYAYKRRWKGHYCSEQQLLSLPSDSNYFVSIQFKLKFFDFSWYCIFRRRLLMRFIELVKQSIELFICCLKIFLILGFKY